MNNARVTVKGTDLTAFTDETGTYRLGGVPRGAAVLEVFFTGMATMQVPVTLTGDGPLEQNVTMGGATSRQGDSDVVELEAFTVTSRPMEGSAIALQERRVAPNIVNVVSADEFGIVPDGNIGEFLKMMPGVVMSYRGGDPREVYLNGAPSGNVPITVGGFGLASTEISGTGRNVELNNISINNLSRVEAIFSVTPDNPGSSLAGMINLVPRNAFERAKPEFRGSVYMNWRDDTAEFSKTKGPRRASTYKALPGFDFSWVVPVNKRFGFSISGGASTQYVEAPLANNVWRGGGAVTNGTSFPDTTPDKPYLTEFSARVESKIAERSSFGLTADYRLAPGSTLSFGFTFGTLHTDFSQRTQTYYIVANNGTAAASRPVAFDPTFTRGAVGQGEIRIQTSANNRYTQTYMPTLRYSYKGSVWEADAGVGLSKAQNIYRNVGRGIFQTTVSRRTGVTVSFEDIGSDYIKPGTITVTDAAGAPVDPFNINSYALNNADGSNEQTKDSSILSVFAKAQRQFDGRWPLSIKAGLQLDQHINDNTSKSLGPQAYRGPDGVQSTTPTGTSDDGAGQFYDPNFFQRTYLFGLGRIQWVDNEAVYENFLANPSHWVGNANTIYRNEVSASKYSDEIISAAFVRGDISLFNRRLLVTGGVRAEQTNIKAQGPLTDPTLNFQRDASGNVLRDTSGNPLLIVPTTDALGVSKLTYIERGAKVDKEYFRLFPSINARFNIRDNLIARAAYYKSIGRPSFNQYSGGVTLPNLEAAPSATNRITLNNPGIKPWTADTFKISLEYYFKRVGLVSVSAFRRDYTDFFASTTFAPTAEFLELFGLDEATYGAYEVTSDSNFPNVVSTEGLEVDYKQALTFLPDWARGIQVFGNISWLRFRNFEDTSVAGLAVDNFNFFVPRSSNFGISLTRAKFNLRLNCNYVARTRQALVTGRGIEEGTYSWRTPRSYLELSGEYSLTKRLALFGSMRNVDDQPEDVEIYGPSTPAKAVFRQRESFGTLVTVGVKGTF